MAIDPRLRERLACPKDRGTLLFIGEVIYNPRLKLIYRIDSDGIPVMLLAESRTASDAEHAELLAAYEREIAQA